MLSRRESLPWPNENADPLPQTTACASLIRSVIDPSKPNVIQRAITRMFGVLVILVGLTSCSSGCHDTEFETWNRADHIVVAVGTNKNHHTITDPARIAKIVAFARAHAEGWGNPWYGTPVGNISLEIYAAEKFLGHLAIGWNFLEAQGCDGDFMSRDLSLGDRAVILSLAGLTEANLK
ncbi:MAG: hypothetical protein JWO52_1212 [Gammaproteobacteria bacterium]|nr:hypothetical protein [Gammaproteobacteria bacterium]